MSECNIKGENQQYEIVKINLERWNHKDEIVRLKLQVSKFHYEIVLDVFSVSEMKEDYRGKLKCLR